MNILIAPDSFKGSISARQFCDIGEKAIKRLIPNARVTKLPMADGGEGTVEALVSALDGKIVTLQVTAPHGESVIASYGYIINDHMAIIEMASASGLPLIPDSRNNPMETTTYGTGELIKDALNRGCKKILLGIGGSGTNDGGLGALTALGAIFTDEEDRPIPYGGRGCLLLKNIDLTGLDSRLRDTEIIIACDVENPLFGKNGAAYIYGPQKGATQEMLPLLDDGLRNLSDCIERIFGVSVKNVPGGGAAGGFGGGFVGILGAKLMLGFDMINQYIGVEERIQKGDYDLIITGEGQINGQTIQGKLPYQIARIGKMCGCPVICIAGSVGQMDEALYDEGMTAVFSIVNEPMSLDRAMEEVTDLLDKCICNIIRLYKIRQ